MNYILIVAFSIILLSAMQFVVKKRETAVCAVVISVVYYFCIYVVASGILFSLEQYSVKRAAIIAFAVSFALLAVSVYKYGWKDIEAASYEKGVWLPYIAIVLLCVFASGHFEFYGMGQDQGVYQTEAINLFYNHTDWEYSMDEYDELEEGEYKDYYQEMVRNAFGFDLMVNSADIPGCKVDEETSGTLGMWHGIPTFASVLALSAKMFGISNMMCIQALFFVCFLFLIEFILSGLQVGVFLRTLCLLLLGISPQIIWVKKSSLTEMFLSLLIVSYLYFILHKDNAAKALAIVPVTAFCFFHVTIFTMIPIFILNFWYLFLITTDKRYLNCVKAILISYASGFYMMFLVQPRYTLLNYSQGLFFLTLKQIPVFVAAACVAAWIITVVLGKKAVKPFEMKGVLGQAFRYVSVVMILFIFFKVIVNAHELYQLKLMTIICYCILTGVFLLPALMIVFIIKKYEYNHTIGILGLMFSWCILLYSIIMIREIAHYYYYGRYIAPYLSIVVILFAYCMKDKKQKVLRLLPLLGIFILIPFANVLRTSQDDSRLEWSVLSDVIESAEGANTILLDSDLMWAFYHPLRASTGGKVYPVKDNLIETVNQIPSAEGGCLYIAKNSMKEDSGWAHIKYRNETYVQEDTLNNTSKILGLVTKIPYRKSEFDVTLYQVETATTSITAQMNTMFSGGWAAKDNEGFRWSTEKDAYVKCYLKKNDYIMTLRNGHQIPFEKISSDEIQVKVFMNEHYIQTIHYTKDNAGMDQEVLLPSQWITEGENTIKFQCDTWSPAEYGSEDRSNYGFSIKSIDFKDGA